MNRSKNGFALTELIVALLVTTIILFGLFRVYNYSWKVSTITKNEAEIQAGISRANERITKEIRWTDELEILNSMPASSSQYENDYFITAKDKSIVIYKSDNTGFTTLSTVTEDVIEDLIFTVSTSSTAENVLDINIQGTKAKIFLDSSLRLLNLNKITGTTGGTIRFKKPIK